MVDVSEAVGTMVASQNFGSIIYWLGYGLLTVVLLGVFFMIYYLTSFNIKAQIWPIYGSAKDGIFSVQQPKFNRVKWIKKETAWRPMKPYFNRKEIEPFDAEYIYPGKRVYAFELNNEWIPGRVNINTTEDKMRAEINPVPYFVRNWQGIQYKQNAMEYANPGWWDENKNLVLGVITVAICMTAMCIAIYLTYQYLAPGRADIQSFTAALQTATTAPNIGPH